MSKYIKEHNFDKNRYFIYARKSTESEDRQVASISAQVEVMSDVAKELGLKVVDVLSESSSGFHVGRRVFNDMIERISKGEADGIIVWKLSRLSRNPDDAGKIMGMLQRKEVKHIRTVDRNWLPEDNVMMMYVEFGVTNQFSRDLSDDTSRGLIKKAERGWSPKASLPLGYMHSPFKKVGEHEILPDPERFDIISKALKKVAIGEMRPLVALEYAHNLGLRTKETKKKKSQPVSESVFYRILSNPFYYGRFEYPEGSGNWFEGKHQKAISEEEFDLIQRYRGHKDRPRPQKHLFPYTGMMKCGECGCSIVVDPKVKVQKNGNKHEYYYYRCTKSKGNCSQKYLEVTKLESQLKKLLESIEIPDAFHEWALEELKIDTEKEIADRNEIKELSQQGYNETVEKINDLVRAYIDKKVPEDAYTTNLKELEKQRSKYKKLIDNTDERISEWIEKTEKVFNFAHDAKSEFERGDLSIKNSILFNLGTNIVIKDLKVSIEVGKPLKIIQKSKPEMVSILETLEPHGKPMSKEEAKILLSKNITWGRRWDSNPQHLAPQASALPLSYFHHTSKRRIISLNTSFLKL